MTAATDYQIGTTFAGLVNLTAIGIPGVQSEFIEWQEEAEMADGTKKALGFPSVEWYFGYLTSAQFDTLRTYCPGASARVYIATMNNDREFIRYSAIMKMPERYQIRVNKPKDFTVLFTHLINAEPT